MKIGVVGMHVRHSQHQYVMVKYLKLKTRVKEILRVLSACRFCVLNDGQSIVVNLT